MTRRTSGTGAVAIIAISAALVLSSCSSSGSGGSSGSPTAPGTTAVTSSGATTSSGAPTSAASSSTPSLAAGTKATGTPITIGYVNEQGGSTLSNPEVTDGINAAVQYANDYLNGLGGHPIKLASCYESADQASAQTCANKMVADKVPVVVDGVTAVDAVLVPTITAAGVPYVSLSATTPTVQANPKAFFWAPGFSGALVAWAKYAATNGIKKLAIFAADAGNVVPQVEGAVKQVFGPAGVSVDVIPVPPTSTDATNLVTAEAAKSPGAIAILGSAATCSAVLTGTTTASVTAQRWILQPCTSASVSQAVPNALDRAKLFTSSDTSSSRADVMTYKAALAKYVPKADPNGLAEQGWIDLISLVEATKSTLKGAVTPASVIASLRKATKVLQPLGHGVTFTCDGKQFPQLTSNCGNTELVVTMKGNNAGTDYQVLNLFSR